MRSQSNGLRLPQALLDQLDETQDSTPTSSRGRGRLRRPKLSRKEDRKQAREEKRQRKAEYFSSSGANSKRVAASPHPDSPPPKKTVMAEPLGSRSLDRESKAKKNPSKLRSTVPILPRSFQEEDEGRYIALLESKLSSGKRSKNGAGYFKDIENDGLGDLLGGLDTITTSHSVKHIDNSHASHLSSDSDFIESDQSEDDEGSDDSGSADLEEWYGFQDTRFEKDTNVEHVPPSDHQPTVQSSSGASPYVPPHLREKSSDSDGVERNVKVTRQLKGLLNKMSEQNLATILDSIEALYREHNRHDVTSSITTFVIESISAHAALLDSYVVLHAALISSLHRIIGVEFAAFFMQNVVSSYERHYDSLSSATTNEAATGPIGKECTNLMVLLSELYNFQVVSCILIYDIIRSLLSAELTEFVVELLLKLLRNSGQQLRQDDPSALKDIIQIVQSKMSGLDTPATSRTRFMLETLTNLKNNKIKRATAQQVRGHTAERLKKLLAGLGKMRHLAPHDPLRVSLGDLHAAETRGKWWLVGAAWRGDPLVEREENSMRTSTGQHGDANALLKLAKKQGMNTDVRRSIFVVLMSSDDYVDACERLAQLNLTEVQQREVVRVIVTCCGNEKAFNPYYAFVCQHLCRTSHSYKITLQFCLWDFLRDLGETSVGGAEVLKNKKGNEDGFELKDVSSAKMRNVANAYAWWVAKGCVALSIFKPVDFTVLKPRTRDFLFHLFHQLFTYTQMSTPIPSDDLPSMRSKGPLEEVFIKATRIQALAMGLVYFLTEIKKASKEEFIQWASAIAIDTLRMGLDVIPTL